MKFRFLKKLNGEKILQTSNGEACAWENVPMVEEEEDLEDKLRKALTIAESRCGGAGIKILMSKKFHDSVKLKHTIYRYSFIGKDHITSYYGYRVYIVDTLFTDFKILQEL